MKFLFLEGSFELVLERMKQRKGHYMKTDMLKVSLRRWKCQVKMNQMLSYVDISGSFEQVIERCVEVLKPLI